MIFDINKQIEFNPQVLNQKEFDFDNVIVGGMGGSALPARVIFYLDPVYPLWLHNDFELPKKIEGKPLFVAISYSGNTAETISFTKEAHDKNFSLAVITSGGALKDFAEKENIPHILVPEGLEPRDALVYMLKSLLTVLGRTELISETEKVQIDLEKVEEESRDIASFLSLGLPVVYAAEQNSALSYLWKIVLNETAKVPAFANSFPELTHNELEVINDKQRIILLTDGSESEGVKNEMKAFLELSGKNEWLVKRVLLKGSRAESLIKTWILARNTARSLASMNGADPEGVPVIENFKKRL
ncbi:MAG: SIS domain-containing protein [Parcubacteria group bacterium]